MIKLMLQVLTAAAGTVGFSLLFGVPSNYYPYCGLIGGIGWLVRSEERRVGKEC